LRITDNGKGITVFRRERARSSGLGLRNMQERIEQLGGTLRILSSPGTGGTLIEAQVPLSHMLSPQTTIKEAV